MAFAVHINMEHCTGSNICAVACPGDALELCMAEFSSDEKICTVGNVNPVGPDSKEELFTGYGVCVRVSLHDGIRLAGPWESSPVAKVQ
jgi:4Fe-4S ferredoxin